MSTSISELSAKQTGRTSLLTLAGQFLGRIIRNHPLGFAGFLVVLTMVMMAAFAPVIAPHDPYTTNVRNRLSSPSREHVFGTDNVGRDVFSRMVFGARISLVVGLGAVALASLIGMTTGIVAGYFGGTTESLLMRLIDMLLAFPTILLAIMIVAFFGASLLNVIIAITITRIPAFARVAHSMTLSLKNTEMVEAARVLGASHLRITGLHMVPNLLAPVVVLATLEVSVAILIETSLGFLGLSIGAPTPTWGAIIQDGRGVLLRAPWIANTAGAMIFLLIIAINVMGDGLRDFLDPRAISARRTSSSQS